VAGRLRVTRQQGFLEEAVSLCQRGLGVHEFLRRHKGGGGEVEGRGSGGEGTRKMSKGVVCGQSRAGVAVLQKQC